MISVQAAKNSIQENTAKGKTILVDLYEACGYASASDIFSPIDFPSFKQSAMDGYAFRFEDWKQQEELYVETEIQAGDLKTINSLKHGEACRIYTGARVPVEADTVVMQEHVTKIENKISITNHALQKGSNVRPKASQTKSGECILTKGTVFTPATVGFLAGLGIAKVEVYEKPTCIIINTGKELVKPSQPLKEGQIYESNSYALIAALQQMNIPCLKIICVDDDETEIENVIRGALSKADILLITGGVSVGEYDFVSKALDNIGVQKKFHKVKQKPGKPLYFGIIEDKIIFGLPGNPASVLTCFYEYVAMSLRLKMGMKNFQSTTLRLPSIGNVNKNAGLTHFLKGKLHQDGVEVLSHQESYKMNSYAEADCLVVLDEEATSVQKGELVLVHLLKF